MKKRKYSFVALICVLVMLFSTVSVNAKEFAYGDVLVAMNTNQVLIASPEEMRAIMPQYINSTCYIEVVLDGYIYEEYYYDGIMSGYVLDPPDSVYANQYLNGHNHTGYLTNYYVDFDVNAYEYVGTHTYREWTKHYECTLYFYGYLECN